MGFGRDNRKGPGATGEFARPSPYHRLLLAGAEGCGTNAKAQRRRGGCPGLSIFCANVNDFGRNVLVPTVRSSFDRLRMSGQWGLAAAIERAQGLRASLRARPHVTRCYWQARRVVGRTQRRRDAEGDESASSRTISEAGCPVPSGLTAEPAQFGLQLVRAGLGLFRTSLGGQFVPCGNSQICSDDAIACARRAFSKSVRPILTRSS